MDYNELISCFQDTIKMSEDELQDATLEAIDNTCVLKENIYEEVFENSNVKIEERPEDADVFVEVNTTFATAKEYLQDGKVAVLNFANPIRPGGGVQNGAIAQEECLCRSSNLYCCLREEKVFEDYYLYHRKMDHYLSTDRLIYSKDITVFKNDNRIPALMPARNWFQVDVITCAAPYLIGNVNIDQNSLKRVFLKRIQNILDAAILNQVDTIILGAFGCGAFKNPPDLVAQAFYEVIYDWDYKKYFKRIVFAIKSTNMKCRNIEIFSKYFIIKSVSEECLIGDKQYFKQWQKTNPYFGKKFSVLGDSISTLEGCHPQGYKVFFKDEICKRTGVVKETDTWWGKVICFFGGELLVNNSWSGSRVTMVPENSELFPSACSDERTGFLHWDEEVPDVILVYLGTNDWGFGALLSRRDKRKKTRPQIANYSRYQEFDYAYDNMLKKLRRNYQSAEIWCCTLGVTEMSSNPYFEFPYEYCGMNIEAYNGVIRKKAKKHKCNIIDLYAENQPYDTIDGTHPNKDGMNTLAKMIASSML